MFIIESEVYTVDDIREKLNVSKNVAYELIKQDLFPVIKIKTVFRIPKKGFDNWLNSSENSINGDNCIKSKWCCNTIKENIKNGL